MKDVDFLHLKKKNREFLSLAKVNRVLVRAVRRDIHFLKLHGLIDYSLLMAVEKSNEKFDQRRVFKARLKTINIMRRASNLPFLPRNTIL